MAKIAASYYDPEEEDHIPANTGCLYLFIILIAFILIIRWMIIDVFF